MEVQPVLDVGSDVLLEVFAKMAQEHEFEMSITLSVAGGIVSGMLIGRDRWLEELARLAEQRGEHAASFGRSLQIAFEQLDLEQEADEETTYGFLHLRDAYFISGATFPTQPPGFLWRGRISEISGWGLGRIGSTSA